MWRSLLCRYHSHALPKTRSMLRQRSVLAESLTCSSLCRSVCSCCSSASSEVVLDIFLPGCVWVSARRLGPPSSGFAASLDRFDLLAARGAAATSCLGVCLPRFSLLGTSWLAGAVRFRAVRVTGGKLMSSAGRRFLVRAATGPCSRSLVRVLIGVHCSSEWTRQQRCHHHSRPLLGIAAQKKDLWIVV